MERQYWIDGFNFFHHWERTRELFARGADLNIARAIDLSLRAFARKLAGRARQTIVFMDGGWRCEEKRLGNLRIRYAGPGEKADDRMAKGLWEIDDGARYVTAVTNDRELGSRLTLLGANRLGVGEYLTLFDRKERPRPGKSRKPRGEEAEAMRRKCQTLSPADVQAWLEFFGCDDGEQ
ncbi:MAG: NYN domain-containing protein [Planctomycetota bacterium]|jgi:predicted RNA-binding protein with PIN domain|nr:NYN domain-containing protein [Planctomycetota bacterium]